MLILRKKSLFQIVVLSVFHFFLIGNIYSQDTLFLSEPNSSYYTYQIQPSQFSYLEVDSSRKMKLEEILNSAEFNVTSNLSNRLKTPNGAIWVKLHVKNIANKPTSWVLIQGDPTVASIQVFASDSSGIITSMPQGFMQPFLDRKIQMVSPAFPFVLSPQENKTLWVKFQSEHFFVFKLIIQDSNFAINYYVKEYYFLGVYYGMLLLMGLYNLILFFSFRSRIYLFYVFYVIATSLVNSLNDKTLFQFLWPDVPELNEWLMVVGQPVLAICVTLYAFSFLPIKKEYPNYYRIAILLTVLVALIFISEALFWRSSIGGYFVLLHLMFIFYLSIKSWKNGFKPARFFVLGFSFVFVGMLVFYLTTQGVFQASWITVYSYNIGVVLEMIVLSGALGDRFRFMQKQQEDSDKKLIDQLKMNEKQLLINEELKTKVNRELEEKVKERTALVEAQAEEIKRFNELLQEDNSKLIHNVKQINQSKILLEDVQFEEFLKTFPDDEACLKFLDEQKWKSGFACRKCQNTNYFKGPSPYSRKCSRCKTIETASANTILHGVKFPLNKALFLIVQEIHNSGKFSLDEISQILDLRRVTCWSFQNKIKAAVLEFEKGKKGKITWIKLLLINPNSKE